MGRTRTKNRNNTTTKSPSHKYGLIPVNNLTYGNPNAAQDILVRGEKKFDYIANHYMDKPYPNNDGKYVKNELEVIKKEMQKLEHAKVVTMCVKFDEDLRGMCADTASKCGVQSPDKFVDEVFSDIDSIIMKLKFYYNRIRPFQLANVYSFPLNPMPAVSANSPSYPSGHTVQSKVISDILTFRYPNHQDMLQRFAEKCSNSRLVLGVHFPSDEVFGLQVAAGIINDNNFKDKYFDVNKISEVSEVRQQTTLPEFNQRPVKNGGKGPNLPDMSSINDVGRQDPTGVFGGMPKQGGTPFPGR